MLCSICGGPGFRTKTVKVSRFKVGAGERVSQSYEVRLSVWWV